jgi:hypothetical protein
LENILEATIEKVERAFYHAYILRNGMLALNTEKKSACMIDNYLGEGATPIEVKACMAI